MVLCSRGDLNIRVGRGKTSREEWKEEIRKRGGY